MTTGDRAPGESMVRYMVLADAAQEVGGKHYILGGGFTQINAARAEPPINHAQLAIAVRIDIPWKATTPAKHTLQVDIIDADARSILTKAPQAQFEAGRPAGMRSEDCQVMNVAINLLNVQFPEFGDYQVVCRIDGDDQATERVRVIPPAGIT